MITIEQVHEFLSHPRIAVVGVSKHPKKFGNVVFRELLSHGYDAIGVHPAAPTIDGVRCYSDLVSIPGEIDGAIVIVRPEASAEVVRVCIARGIPRIWLFKGIGAPGSNTAEAVELCRVNGTLVIDGACPLMFLEPVGAFHRLHRRMRTMKRSLGTAA
jgi:hypothetical protein